MFQIRHFYYRLWANKFSIRTFSSNWHNSNAIFGGQILQSHGFWNFNQQFTQRYQFCTEISSPIDDSANSISPISSETEMPTSIEQNEQQEIPSIIVDKDKIYRVYHQLTNFNRKMLRLRLLKDKNGQKFFRIVYKVQFRRIYLIILVPEDAYAFVHKMDELIKELRMENFGQKFKGQSTSKTVEIIGKLQKYKLNLFFLPNEDDDQKQLCFIRVFVFYLDGKIKTRIDLPLEALLWLREKMVDMLIRHDGTEMIERGAHAKIPKQLLTDGLVLYRI